MTSVLKFRSGNMNDLDSFFEDYLWFSSLENLNDPFEGFVNYCNSGVTDGDRITFLNTMVDNMEKRTLQAEWVKRDIRERYSPESNYSRDDNEIIKAQRDHYESLRNEFSAASLSYASLAESQLGGVEPLQNVLMWGHYSNGFRGFCIEYDLETLVESMQTLSEITLVVRDVKYSTGNDVPTLRLRDFMEAQVALSLKKQIDDELDPIVLQVLDSLTTKEASWQYEHEVRILGHFPGYSGRRVHFEPKAIKAVYIASKLPRWAQHFIKQIVREKNTHEGTNITVYLADVSTANYSIALEQVD